MNPASRRRVTDNESPAEPVTILDALGQVVRILSAEEFRRTHGIPERSTTDNWRRKRSSVKANNTEEGAAEIAIR